MERLVPNIVAMLRVVVHDRRDLTLGWCDDQSEFEFGLDRILDGLERALDAGIRHPRLFVSLSRVR